MTKPHSLARSRAFWGLLAAGLGILAIRLAFAWLYMDDVNPDGAVVQLMVRHVAEGGPWPVFFYGQAYMGSFEPLLGALVAKLFGYSPFAACCGTAILGTGAIVCAALWARRAAGPLAGWVAAAMLAIGLQPCIHYFASPRGGYGALLCFTMATLALGGRQLDRELRGIPAGMPAYTLLGFCAGLGSWCHFLTLPAAGAVALAFLAWRRWRAFRVRILLPAAAGFLAGSLPLWVWNIRNHWASGDMSAAVGFSPLGAIKSIRLLLGPRLLELLGLERIPSRAVAAAVIAVHALVLLPAIALLLPGKRRAAGEPPATPSPDATGHETPASDGARLRAQVGIALIWMACLTACFAVSPQYTSFHSPRYLLPYLPVAAWLAGVGAAKAPRRWVRAATLALACACIGWQLYGLKNSWSFHLRQEKRRAAMMELGESMAADGIATAYASYLFYMLNPALGERMVATDPRLERFAPYARRIEIDPAPAVIDNIGGITKWAGAAGGSFSAKHTSGGTYYHSIRPPATPLAEVPLDGAEITAMFLAQGAKGRAVPVRAPIDRATCDRRHSTCFADRLPRDTPEDIFFSFPEPTAVSAVRLWGEVTPPASWEVAVPDDSAEDGYRTLVQQVGGCGFFWSGPRFYWMGPQFHHEVRFPQTVAREFRVRFVKNAHRPHFSVPEIQLLRDAPESGEGIAPGPDRLVELLRERGVTRLFADRWLANEVHERTGDAIWTSRDPRGMTDPADQAAATAELSILPGTAVLMPLCGAPSLRDALAARGVSCDEEPLPPFGILFTPRADANAPDTAPSRVGIRVAGQYALLVGDAEWAAARIGLLGEAPGLDEARRLARLAPYDFRVLSALTNAMADAYSREAIGNSYDFCHEFSSATARLDILRSPLFAGPVAFMEDVFWLGATLGGGDSDETGAGASAAEAAEPDGCESICIFPKMVRPGDLIMATFFWSGNLRKLERHVAFVHFVGPGGYRFQDDHALGLDLLHGDDPVEDGDPLLDSRIIRIPPDAPYGHYELRLGFYPVGGGSRLVPRPCDGATVSIRRRAIVIKDLFDVAPLVP